jgi:uncharacterized protein YijF (DUF1287 family)
MRRTGLLIFVALAGAHTVRGQGHTMPEGYAQRLAAAALEQTRASVTYDGSYRRIAYPGGDVPANIGVCADVIIRAYRSLGADLQVKVHEDMRRDFAAYPRIWGLQSPDTNIDHRRVPNLRTFLRRAGAEITVSTTASSYRPGDLVTWTVPPNLPHIGIVSDRIADSGRPMMVHNIGRGPELEDMLFQFPITGHYRYAAR